MPQLKMRVWLIFATVLMLFGCAENQPVPPSITNNLSLERPAAPAIVSKIAFGSCNKHDLPQPLWQAIASNKPDLWIWLGDIVYADTNDMALMQRKYEAQKANPGYQALLKTTTIIGMWDDHDYGKNNGGKEYPKKAESQQLLLNFLDEPANSPRRQQKGIYAAYTYGPPGKQVKVILLDGRYNRDAPGTNGDILGEEQWTWLENQLKNSKAQIHLIASGIQVIPEEQKYEKWANFPKARQRLFDLIVNSKVPGAIFLSGDRHFAEISKIKTPAMPYPLYDITSSGLTHSWEGLKKEANRYRQGNFFKSLHFGWLEIDWDSKPIVLKLQIRDSLWDSYSAYAPGFEENASRTFRVQLEQKIALTELQPAKK